MTVGLRMRIRHGSGSEQKIEKWSLDLDSPKSLDPNLDIKNTAKLDQKKGKFNLPCVIGRWLCAKPNLKNIFHFHTGIGTLPAKCFHDTVRGWIYQHDTHTRKVKVDVNGRLDYNQLRSVLNRNNTYVCRRIIPEPRKSHGFSKSIINSTNLLSSPHRNELHSSYEQNSYLLFLQPTDS
jgi:hypothetical protein